MLLPPDKGISCLLHFVAAATFSSASSSPGLNIFSRRQFHRGLFSWRGLSFPGCLLAQRLDAFNLVVSTATTTKKAEMQKAAGPCKKQEVVLHRISFIFARNV